MRKVTLADLQAVHPQWFKRGNAEFFGDTEYRVLQDSDGDSFLVRKTSQWSDMFGGPKKYVYRVNPLGPAPELKILPVLDNEFATLELVQEWLGGAL